MGKRSREINTGMTEEERIEQGRKKELDNLAKHIFMKEEKKRANNPAMIFDATTWIEEEVVEDGQ